MNNLNPMEIATAPAIWISAGIAVVLILIETILFLKMSYKAAKHEDVMLETRECNLALKTGIISSIGPACAIFIIMIGMISILGGPMSWLRTTIIGSCATELFATSIGVQVAGGDLTQGMSTMEMLTAWWTMTVNGCGWLIIVVIFGNRLDKIRDKVSGGDIRWKAVFSSAASIGIMGFIVGRTVIDAAKIADFALIGTAVAAGLAMAGFRLLGKKYKWVTSYSLGFAMAIGLCTAVILS